VLVNGQTAYRHGSFYHHRVELDNSQGPLVETVDIQEVVGDQSIARVFIPQTPETFTHDEDGNLTQDGVWNYEWDAENRLRAMWPRPEVATVMLGSGIEYWPRIEFAYDFMGRRIAKDFFKSQTDPATVKGKNSGTIVWAASGYQHRFVNDGC